MKTRALKYLLLFFLSGVHVIIIAQQKDFSGLLGVSATHNLDRSWDVSLAAQTLFNQNINELWIASADVGAGYQLNSNWKMEVHYRPIRFRNLDNNYESRNLFYHTLTYTKGAGKFSFSIRNRMQQLVYGDHFNDNFKGPRWYNRDKFTVKYRLDYYWSVSVAAESFLPLNNPARDKLDQLRTGVGIERTINDRMRIDGYYTIQQQLNRKGNDTGYLAALNLYYKF